MKPRNYLIFFLISLTFQSIIFSQDFVEIKSLQTSVVKGNSSIPIFNRSDSRTSRLSIEFDVDAETPPQLEIRFKFCNKNWVPEDNLFLNNPFRNYVNNLWLRSLPTTVKMAYYHYKGTFPNEQVRFPFDGKWIYEIVNTDDADKVLDGGKFIVVSNNVRLNVHISESSIINTNVENNEMNKAYEMSVSFNLPDSLYPGYVENVEIIQNRLFDYPIIIKKEVTDNRYLDWDGARHFVFGAKDVYPGNNYRQTNLMNHNRFAPPVTNAHLDRIETSNFYVHTKPDLFGGMKLLDWNNAYSQYMDVNFTLRAPDKLYKDVFLVGAFTDWEIWPAYKMEENDGLYTTTVELKRGIYDYQYVLGYEDNGNITDTDWLTLEGNDFSRRAIYNIFVFYRSQENGGYDRIIGYKRILINGK